jgi:hypothetical protein
MPDQASQKLQIIETLKQRYFPFVLPLPQNWTPEQHEKNRLSRSMAAFAIEKLADVTLAQAVNAVMDGGNDNGLDAIHFDRPKNILWVVQSKAGGAPDMGENKKFCDGIRDLVSGRFNKFNANFARLQPDVEDALATDRLQIMGCDIHLGSELGPHGLVDLDQLRTELNQFVQRFEWKDLKLEVVHGWLTAEHAVAPVLATLTLEKWYGVDNPRRAFYGLVSAQQLATLYQTHGKALFEKNIRHYLGEQTVNMAIAATVQDRPTELFYLNNGLTAVCATITPVPGATNKKGVFSLHGFSVVNGAQTVGSIATAHATNGGVPADAKVLITLIEVGTAPDNLGPQITRCRNTQNAVKGLHFAALDPEQERLRQELRISGIHYHYRPSAEAVVAGPGVILLEQAAIALACLSGATRTVVAAKKESGQIYDQTGPYYPALFRGNLSGIQLCRAVRIHQYLNEIFAASERVEQNYSARKMFFRHGRFFILHILARRSRRLIDKAEPSLSDADKAELSRAALELAELVYTAAEAMFNRSKGYLSIFRNMTDAEPLARDAMQRLAQQDAQRQPAAAAPTTPNSPSSPGTAIP